MDARQLISLLLDDDVARCLNGDVIAVDQFGATESPVMGVRVDDGGRVILDIEVETDDTPEYTPPPQVAEF